MSVIRRYECDRAACPHYGEPMTHPCYQDGHTWRVVEYVPRADADRGVVDRIAALEAEVARLRGEYMAGHVDGFRAGSTSGLANPGEQ